MSNSHSSHAEQQLLPVWCRFSVLLLARQTRAAALLQQRVSFRSKTNTSEHTVLQQMVRAAGQYLAPIMACTPKYSGAAQLRDATHPVCHAGQQHGALSQELCCFVVHLFKFLQAKFAPTVPSQRRRQAADAGSAGTATTAAEAAAANEAFQDLIRAAQTESKWQRGRGRGFGRGRGGAATTVSISSSCHMLQPSSAFRSVTSSVMIMCSSLTCSSLG